MAWDHLAVNRPHLVYIILGGFTSLFMLCSSFIKERLYIGEATVATICGVIFGPHAANLIDPGTWGNTDQITLEFSRIVLVVQCFAVGVELPKYYMEKHWRSVVFLLIPVMTYGWLVTSLFIWWMVPKLNWLDSLCVAACVTATDPVLASSVVGKGKFAKRVPKHLRDVLSAESGCNDGMAFPFIYLALYLIEFRPDANKVSFNWVILTIIYECVFGAFYGFMIGYIGRHGIKYAERHDLVDRESFLVFYFVLALFCAGSGSILGVDDLLVGFAAGVGFSNDGWFTQKTEESHVSNVIDLLINLAYFVYLGTIIPWEQYNSPEIGTTPWKLVIIALFVIFFRRIPIMLALKPVIPDIKTWREALFAGHFGPIGVGAIFVAILAKAELETKGTTPVVDYPITGEEHSTLVALIWPITTFLVIASIIVHGSSIAVFTLGRHINTLTLTMSYTKGGEDGPGWLNRLPRVTSISKSQAKSFESGSEGEGGLMGDLPPGTLPPVGVPGHFLRRQREEDNPSRQGSRASSLVPRRRKKKWDDGRGPGGPISQSAIFPQRRSQGEQQSEYNSETLTPGGSSPENEKVDEKDYDNEKNERDLGEVQYDPEMQEILHRQSREEEKDQHKSDAERHPEEREVYQEGEDIIVENEDGEIVDSKIRSHSRERREKAKKVEKEVVEGIEQPVSTYRNLRKKYGIWRNKDEDAKSPKESKSARHKRGPALAYQFGNTIIVEDEDGEVVKTYELPNKTKGGKVKEDAEAGPSGSNHPKDPHVESNRAGAPTAAEKVRQPLTRLGSLGNWGFGGKNTETAPEDVDEADDDRRIRFTVGGSGRRLTKEDFLKEIQSLDPKTRYEVIEESDAPDAMKHIAKKDASGEIAGSNRLFDAKSAQMTSGKGTAKAVGAEMARRRGARIDEADEEEDDDSEQDYFGHNHQRRAAKIAKSNSPRRLSKAESPSTDEPETAAERKRREKALRGIDDITPAQRGRPREREDEESRKSDSPASDMEETAAERRRREAAFGISGDQEDSDDDDTPRVPPPVAKSRGIRFAQSPVRG